MSRCFLPPVNRTMTTLDRSFFQKTFPITVAHVFDSKNVCRVQRECVDDVLTGCHSVKSVVSEEDITGNKRMLVRLKPNVKHDDMSTACGKTREFVKSKILELIPYNLHMAYENWQYDEIVGAILPEELTQNCPNGFTRVGHVVQLNLQNKFLPYKHILAAIFLDKNPGVKTVVNKIGTIGSWSDFRTLPIELLAGSPDTKVVVRESNCEFHFDLAKVYWNSRLINEHQRIVGLLKPGEAVADVMAGVGSFAIPAAKKGVIVWANDLNPAAYTCLKENISINKVYNIVQPFNLDAQDFIRTSIRNLLTLSRASSILNNSVKVPRRQFSENMQSKLRSLGKPEYEINPPPVYIRRPPTFSHIILSNPSTVPSCLDAFIGAYHGLENLYFDTKNLPKRELPLVHIYFFQKKSLGVKMVKQGICKAISKSLKHSISPDDLEHLEQVKMIGPEKCFYCVSLRLPAEVMFADVPLLKGEPGGGIQVKNWLKWIQCDAH